MVVVAQSVRAPDCGSGGRRFEPGLPPKKGCLKSEATFYFNGTHADYHKPTDTPDKIEYELMAKRAQLIFQTTWELANRDERIKMNR